jgi:PAS domain S-box-containing protein
MQRLGISSGMRWALLAGAVVLLAPPLVWPPLWTKTLSNQEFLPHSFCYVFDPATMWLNAGSDVVIGLSYFLISGTLAFLVHRAKQEIPFSWMFLAFGVFIVACGMTHLMEVWTLWDPRYWLAGEIKVVTSVASVATALALPPLVPRVLNMVKDARLSRERKLQLEAANAELNRLNARLQELDEMKTRFFANVSHELRTPLALILGPAERLRTGAGLSAEQAHALEVIERNGRMLLSRVNELLDLSKLDAGHMEVHPADADLARMTRVLGAHFESLARERHIRFDIDAPASLVCRADEDKLQRVALNLLSNAFKFTPKYGHISWSVRTERDQVVLEVQDSGPGIPAEMRETVFERFRQLPNDTQQSLGTGLGLAIVKEFVVLHRGHVAVDDSALGGATFRVEIPLIAAQGEPAPQSSPPHGEALDEPQFAPPPVALAVATRAAPGAASVLIVEDNADMRSFLEESLADTYRVVTAVNGGDGLARAAEFKPDLILSDIMMPGMSGEELLRQLRRHPELKSVPVLLLSAKHDEEFGARILREGAQDYLHKPFGVAELRARVKNLVSMHRARDVLQKELRSQDEDVSRLTGQLISNRQALQDSERRWRAVFENSAVGIGLTDASGRFLATNPAMQRMLGYAEAELRELSMTEITFEDERGGARALLSELTSGATREVRVLRRFLRGDGGFIWGNTTISAIADTDKTPRMLVGVVEDVTERKRAEEALAETRAELARVARVTTMGELAASISHELNQPLAALAINASACQRWLAAQPPNMEEANAAAARANREALRARDVVARIRGFLRREEITKTPVKVDEVVHEAVGLVEDMARTNNVSVHVDTESDLPNVLADRVQLQQVIVNLAMNAIEAMIGVSGRERRLQLAAQAGAAQSVLVAVRDSGPGLKEEDRSRIFDAFFSTKPGGMGMGLAISRSIIESHGGRLWEAPNDGAGETFQFSLPGAAA